MLWSRKKELSTNHNKNLLNLQDVLIKKIDKDENTFKIHIEMPVKEQTCPHCKNKTKYIHGYRKQAIKDIEGYYPVLSNFIVIVVW